MAATAQVATGQKTRSHSYAPPVCLCGLVVTLALHRQRTTETNVPSEETTQLVPAILGVSTAATAYAAAATDSGGERTERMEKVRVGQQSCLCRDEQSL